MNKGFTSLAHKRTQQRLVLRGKFVAGCLAAAVLGFAWCAASCNGDEQPPMADMMALYHVGVNGSLGGKVKVSRNDAWCGNTVTLTIQSDDGYSFIDDKAGRDCTIVTKSDMRTPVPRTSDAPYGRVYSSTEACTVTFTMPSDSVTVNVTFTQETNGDATAP
jgi:hypothetical protein